MASKKDMDRMAAAFGKMTKNMTAKQVPTDQDDNLPGQQELTKDYPETVPVKHTDTVQQKQEQEVTVIPMNVILDAEDRKEDKPVAVKAVTIKKEQHKVKDTPVSIWFDRDTKKQLKALSQATGRSVSGIVTEAVSRYMNIYPLNEDEKTIFETALKLLG